MSKSIGGQVSKKPSLHDAKLRGIKAELSDEERDEKKMFRTSVILRESQKLALEEERLRLRREEGKSVAITEMIREAVDDWLSKRRRGDFGKAADAFNEGMKRGKKRR